MEGQLQRIWYLIFKKSPQTCCSVRHGEQGERNREKQRVTPRLKNCVAGDRVNEMGEIEKQQMAGVGEGVKSHFERG